MLTVCISIPFISARRLTLNQVTEVALLDGAKCDRVTTQAGCWEQAPSGDGITKIRGQVQMKVDSYMDVAWYSGVVTPRSRVQDFKFN